MPLHIPLLAALVADSGSGMFAVLVLLGDGTVRAVFPSVVVRPEVLDALAGMDQKDFAVHVVRELGGAPGPVHRQSGGYSCFMSMDLADPSLEREVQWDFRVDSSSCGAHCGVVHSPFEWLYHRCHCN